MHFSSLKYGVATGLFLLLQITAFSQASSENYKKAQEYKKVYPDQEAVALAAKHAFTFSLDKVTKAPVVVEQQTFELMSLRVNNYLQHVSFYDNNSTITNSKLRWNQVTAEVTKTCGNFEVDQIFHSDVKMCSFKVPFSKAGSEAALELTKKYTDLRYFTAVYLNTPYPTEKREVTFEIPDDIEVEIREFNFAGFDIKKTKTHNPKRQKTTYTYLVENLQPLAYEEKTRGRSYVYPHLLVLTKSYQAKEGTKRILSSTDDLYAWYAGLAQSVKNDPKPLEPQVKLLTNGKTSDEEKIKAIYYWVQDNIRYIAFEAGLAGFRPEAAHLVFQKKYGDCKGMANLTKEMLKIAGFDARLTWVGTNAICYDYSIPSLAVDNHMVCTVFLNGKPLVLDATEKYIAFNDYGERIQGRPILVEDGTEYHLLQVPVLAKERNLVQRQIGQQITGNTLTGSGKVIYNGETKTALLNLLHDSKTQNRENLLQSIANLNTRNTVVENVQASDYKNREESFSLTYDFTSKSRISAFGDEIYLTIDPDQDFKDLQVTDRRQADLYFNEKVQIKSFISLQIPEGYTVTHVPAPLLSSNPGFSFAVKFRQEGNTLIYEKEITVEEGLVKKADFVAWNTSVKELKKLYDDQVILTKTGAEPSGK